jgi:hypothetical protein
MERLVAMVEATVTMQKTRKMLEALVVTLVARAICPVTFSPTLEMMTWILTISFLAMRGTSSQRTAWHQLSKSLIAMTILPLFTDRLYPIVAAVCEDC